jgi:hypothetical protein
MMAKTQLSAYNLACGDIEQKTPRPEIVVTLWREHGCYHVRAHNFNTKTRLLWFVTPRLKEARSYFNTAIRHIKTGILY